jgi:small-conductance mechanosensitive channel
MIPPLAGIFSDAVSTDIVFVAIGLAVFLVFVIASRLVAQSIGNQLHKRHLPVGMIVLGRRVVTVLLLVIGVWAAVGFAIQSANVTLLGILLATVVAAFGVQDLLKDYVSGYYVLLERHIRPGDRITLEGAGSGTVMDVKLRVTLMQSEAGDLLVVPNSELFGKAVTVHARAAERAAEAEGPKSELPK